MVLYHDSNCQKHLNTTISGTFHHFILSWSNFTKNSALPHTGLPVSLYLILYNLHSNLTWWYMSLPSHTSNRIHLSPPACPCSCWMMCSWTQGSLCWSTWLPFHANFIIFMMNWIKYTDFFLEKLQSCYIIFVLFILSLFLYSETWFFSSDRLSIYSL